MKQGNLANTIPQISWVGRRGSRILKENRGKIGFTEKYIPCFGIIRDCGVIWDTYRKSYYISITNEEPTSQSFTYFLQKGNPITNTFICRGSSNIYLFLKMCSKKCSIIFSQDYIGGQNFLCPTKLIICNSNSLVAIT